MILFILLLPVSTLHLIFTWLVCNIVVCLSCHIDQFGCFSNSAPKNYAFESHKLLIPSGHFVTWLSPFQVINSITWVNAWMCVWNEFETWKGNSNQIGFHNVWNGLFTLFYLILNTFSWYVRIFLFLFFSECSASTSPQHSKWSNQRTIKLLLHICGCYGI